MTVRYESPSYQPSELSQEDEQAERDRKEALEIDLMLSGPGN